MDLEEDFQLKFKQVLEVVERKERVIIEERDHYLKLAERYRKDIPKASQRLKVALEKIPRLRAKNEKLEKKIERLEDRYQTARTQIAIVTRERETNEMALRKENKHGEHVLTLAEKVKVVKEKFELKYRELAQAMRKLGQMEQDLATKERKLATKTVLIKQAEDKIATKKFMLEELEHQMHEKTPAEQEDLIKRKTEELTKRKQELFTKKAKVKKLEERIQEREKTLNTVMRDNVDVQRTVEKEVIEKLCKVTKKSYNPPP